MYEKSIIVFTTAPLKQGLLRPPTAGESENIFTKLAKNYGFNQVQVHTLQECDPYRYISNCIEMELRRNPNNLTKLLIVDATGKNSIYRDICAAVSFATASSSGRRCIDAVVLGQGQEDPRDLLPKETTCMFTLDEAANRRAGGVQLRQVSIKDYGVYRSKDGAMCTSERTRPVLHTLYVQRSPAGSPGKGKVCGGKEMASFVAMVYRSLVQHSFRATWMEMLVDLQQRMQADDPLCYLQGSKLVLSHDCLAGDAALQYLQTGFFLL